MIRFLLITADPTVASAAIEAGVDRIFVDLEARGKRARQAGRDTVISGHTLRDVARVRACVPEGRLLARVNPLHPGSEAEIDAAIDEGADLLMVPMVGSAADVHRAAALVAGRAQFVPLVETGSALGAIDAIVRVPGVDEIYIGLNDLHLSLGMGFLFEPLGRGLLDHAAHACTEAGVPFGFGGIARIGGGELPAEWILAEHVRLGSTAVILSRAFASGADGLLADSARLRGELAKIREAEARLRERVPEQVEADRARLARRVAEIARARIAPESA